MSIGLYGATGQWHLDGTGASGFSSNTHLNVQNVWSTTGGTGVSVVVVDDGIEATHSQLAGSISNTFYSTEQESGSDGDPSASSYGHGTAVAGIIAADASTSDPVGIAPGADLASLRIFGANSLSLSDALSHIASHDIANNSWGYSIAFYAADTWGHSTYWSGIESGLDTALTNGRDGLGTVFVKSAGNSREDGRYATDDYVSSHKGSIVVGATDHTGSVSFYSTPGANLLVSAPSSGAGVGVTTTDRTGSGGYSSTNQTDAFGGTSAAAPMVSGVVALMLEANPALAWHDVQDILALSARHTGSAVGASTSGHELHSWQMNAAANWNGTGLHYSNDYGFGLVDAHQAVRLAETWGIGRALNASVESTATAANWTFNTVTSTATAQFLVTSALDLHTVTLALDMNIELAAVETIRLVSPDGTTSLLFSGDSDATASAGTHSWDFLSQAFRGEASAGVWTVEVDFGNHTVNPTGLGGTLEITGTADTSDDVYYFTSEFAEFGERELSDAAGTDTLNAAAIADDVRIDLTPGVSSNLDGASLIISQSTLIEQVVTGDGNDTITGNDLGNLISAGRGDDTVAGGAGNDLFFEGLGNDVYDGGTGTDFVFVDSVYDSAVFEITRVNATDAILFSHTNEQNQLVSVERMAFADGTQIAFDNEGSAGQIYRLYETAFNRAPDETGFEEWVEAADNGMSLQAIAASFVLSDEYAALYSGFETVEDKVAAFYLNSLNREAEEEGLHGWAAAYSTSTIDDSGILLGFSESQENKIMTSGVFNEGFIF